MLNNLEAADELTAVIAPNDAILKYEVIGGRPNIPCVAAKPIYQDEEFAYVYNLSLNDCDFPSGGTPNPAPNPPRNRDTYACQRDRDPNGYDFIKGFQFNNEVTLNRAMAGDRPLLGRGHLEFMVFVSYPQKSGTPIVIKKITNVFITRLKGGCNWVGKKCNMEYATIDLRFERYKKDLFGELLNVSLWEDDPKGNTTEHKISSTFKDDGLSVSNSTSVKVTLDDFYLGDFFVEYCDPILNNGSRYDTGFVFLDIYKK